MCKHETDSWLLALVLFALYTLMICSTFVLSTLATVLKTYLLVYLFTDPEHLVEHFYPAFYYRFN